MARRGGNGGRLIVLAAGAAAVTVLLVWLVARYPDAVRGGWARMDVVYLVSLLALVASGLLLGGRIGLRGAARSILAWLAIGLVLVLGFAWRYELRGVWERLVGALLPHQATVARNGAIVVRAGPDGHYRMEVAVDGTPIRFLVDTGASDIVLSPADARRLGLDPRKLDYTKVYGTANGAVRGAPVRLRSMAVGGVRFENVPASVNRAAMDSSLLGMAFLDRFRGYAVREGALTLYP